MKLGNRTPGEIAQDVATAIAEEIGAGSAPESDLAAPAHSSRPQNAVPLALTGTSGMTWTEIYCKDVDDNLSGVE